MRLEFRLNGIDSKEHVWKFMNKNSAKTEVKKKKQCRFGGRSRAVFMKIYIWPRNGENVQRLPCHSMTLNSILLLLIIIMITMAKLLEHLLCTKS